MNVKLIAYTQPVNGGNPMDVVEEAACVCYDSEPTAQHRIAKGCKASGHLSVYEHINFVFHVSGVSRALLAQLTRHRHFGFSVRSQRYCNEDGFNWVNPFNDSMAANQLSDAMFEAMRNYQELEALGADNEDARMVLPNACCTELVVSANARALIEASHLRLCTRAQKEIRDLFAAMKAEVETVCPEVASYMVPQCEKYPKYPFCTEHESCGRHPKLSEVYKSERSAE